MSSQESDPSERTTLRRSKRPRTKCEKKDAETQSDPTKGATSGGTPKRQRLDTEETGKIGVSYQRPLSSLLFGSKLRLMKPEPAVAPAQAKPLKVCDVRRNCRIGIVASTLQKLRTKIQDHFSITGSEEFEVVLEEDCTRVEDEEYFQTLPDNTVLMVVYHGQHWTKASTSLAEDTRGLVEVDGAGPSDSSNHLARVAERIARNPAVMAFLPKMDLEVVTDSDINQLQVLLHQSKDDAQFIQDACEKRLNELIRSEEATALLKLYDRAKTETGNGSPSSTESRPVQKSRKYKCR
ncbi:uncharacterized protein LOC119745511 [Patiria miniata]|uniref:CIDE-N domain-containing protein n=1 Tax=Patiria miniata TaxID=46514 RepID=A0A914BNG1_PATMI|nr:uncharacterized protein LOC119745511 [Patiria miniata]XP_038077818.1 uncharacterized protein LOC119745511 [Patiria miniata]XP_038077819.1 uncharacterized protein LOC119745511 [Patiria miniata]XP_038077820.1 uncharacterized protein LOC119745511 [Patiria miniata]